MVGYLLRCEHLNVRRAVEQNRLAGGLEPDAQHPVRGGLFASVNHAPDAVQLIMAVQGQAAGEAGQQGFAPGVDMGNPLTNQRGLVGLQPGKGEPDVG